MQPPDIPADVPGDGRWLTYRQIAELRGISRDSAERLVRRHRWRRQADNRGAVRAYVPLSWVEQIQEHSAPDDLPDIPGDVTPAPVVEMAIAGLVARAERAETEADRERGRADALQQRVETLLAQVATAEADVKAANDRAWASGEAVAAAEQQAERAESRAANEHEDMLDAENRARRAGVDLEAAEGRVAGLRERIDAMQAQLAEAHATLQAAAEAERAREGERAQAEAVRVRLTATEAQAKAAQQSAAVLQRDLDERRGLGRFARLRRAWRGE
jgi:hypothetical protein